MASKLINLNQLKIAVASVKNYADNVYAKGTHTHEDLYASYDYVDKALIDLQSALDNKADIDHTHESNSIERMTGYSMANKAELISPNDSLNTAIGKLEASVYTMAAENHEHNDKYLGINDTAKAAKRLEKEVNISLGGSVTGSVYFDGSADVVIDTSITPISSNKIVSMTGYSKSGIVAPIEEKDSLNTALGKLEAALDQKQDIGDSDLQEAQKYIDQKVADIIGGEDIPDSLNTLRKIASALKDDSDIVNKIQTSLNNKADKKHEHDLATKDTAGFMPAEDKEKLDTVETGANNYKHPTTTGNKHIPAGGEAGQILTWSSDGTAEWALIMPDSASDSDVKNVLDKIFDK